MEVSEAIRARRSVRAYDSRPIPDDLITKVLEAGRIAPSASNYQPWHFIVVKDASKRQVLSEGKFAKFLTESPVVIVGCGDRKTSPKWYVVDTTIALQQMVIAATAEGLGTCWIGSFDEDSVREALSVPERFAVVAMLAVGYPKQKPGSVVPPTRTRNVKELEKIVSYEEFDSES
jgi:nitroreductase